MRIRVNATQMKALADKAMLAVEAKSTFADKVLVSVEPGGEGRVVFSVTGSSSMLYGTAFTAVEDPLAETGEALVPASRLRDALATLRAGDMSLHSDAEKLSVQCDSVTWNLRLAHGRSSVAAPAFTDEQVFEGADRQALYWALSRSLYAVERDAAGQAPRAMILSESDIHAADSARSHTERGALPKGLSAQLPVGSIPPIKSFLRSTGAETVMLARSDDALTVGVKMAEDPLRVGGILTVSQVSSEVLTRFRGYRPASDRSYAATLARADLIAAVHRVRIASDETQRSITLRFGQDEQRMYLASRDSTGNVALDSVPVEWDGPAQTVVVEHTHLLEAVRNLAADQIRLQVEPDTAARGSKPPVVLSTDSSVATIAQLRA